MSSTKFTKVPLHMDPPAPMIALLHTGGEWFVRGTLDRLWEAGFTSVTSPQIVLFAHLECGATHASALAQRMGVSRQAVYRTLKELQVAGFLVLDDDPMVRNQKIIRMTETGVALATAGRSVLHEVEAQLSERIGARALQAMRDALERGWGVP